MKQCYIPKKFKAEALALIAASNQVLEEWARRGRTVTLRQLYYQLVTANIIPNKQTEYSRLGAIISDARMAGLVDWDHIIDRTRNLRSYSTWNDPSGIIKSAAGWYRRDHWEGQDYRVEVWVEKDALVDIIGEGSDPWQVPYFSCRGYTSASEMRVAGLRLMRHIRKFGQVPVVLHLGDHDPSGFDMSRDIEERLRLFMGDWGDELIFERIALNPAQVDEYEPPPNPAKSTDSRFAEYEIQYGDESWELDALDPDLMVNLITTKIQEYLDFDKYQAILGEEEEEQQILDNASVAWPELAGYLQTITTPEIPGVLIKPTPEDFAASLIEANGIAEAVKEMAKQMAEVNQTSKALDKIIAGMKLDKARQAEEHPDSVCPFCAKIGASKEVSCHPCEGTGQVLESGFGCPMCRGKGKVVVCDHCLASYPLAD